jgi:hypothetical protein
LRGLACRFERVSDRINQAVSGGAKIHH